jgi:MoxR-like ATPase
VTQEDIRVLAAPVLRHRILLNYKAEAEGLNIDRTVERLVEGVK